MTGARLALPIVILAALIVLAALLLTWGRWEQRHAERIAELHNQAGTKQQDDDALMVGTDREGWNDTTEGPTA